MLAGHKRGKGKKERGKKKRGGGTYEADGAAFTHNEKIVIRINEGKIFDYPETVNEQVQGEKQGGEERGRGGPDTPWERESGAHSSSLRPLMLNSA